MQPVDYSQIPLETLQKKLKTMKTATGVLGGSMIFMALAGGFLTAKQGFSAFSILPVAFLPMLIVNITGMKKIKAAIEAKQAKGEG